ncbi:hypothetical protein P344_03735 [Spiroplasma mirum ATCC 29335]|uniref:Sucrose phosphatase-like domain-containing protein n=1 Tax=Spiroplasma mirum ATCC 29335 TaxID=838561 RepID=W0GPN3_9MOLU|nr:MULTISPECIES: HAD hydrolase family protein [Spiroplasma]AHF61053.1 truncated HAD superfamily hydrolase [Spiroplasma mirum ATCC 29335]AHI58087.1 hypothetical protein P344_03735 [Spiroplasma mirum ATCC 29335]
MSLITKYPYIITDLDRTITRKDFTISDKTYEALRIYQLASDYKLILASGQLDLIIKEYADKLQIKIPIISCNMIYGPEKTDRIQMVLNYNKTASKPEYQIEVDTTSDFAEQVRQNKI